jgi:HAMP domain-containing protein
MNRTLLNALIAAAAVASVCLLALGWLLQVLLERPLTAGEWVLAVLAGMAAIAVYMQAWRLRHRRKIEDMRDSALW